ncbi:hypothetical protein [Algoriphagus algorifonticola]|uniref:hypothetical protein n=1 Tax=Algoriphagus algorifonticola TaxID=2593007 RepID=UPI0011A402F6|nr:hypothetical protein [Algoriphagus algorifonticola]
MAGGAGFMKQAIHSLKDNRELRKIRPTRKEETPSRSGNNASQKSIKEAISHRFSKRDESFFLSRIIWIGMISLLLLICLVLYLMI